MPPRPPPRSSPRSPATCSLVSGGVSVGPHDHVKPALQERGVGVGAVLAGISAAAAYEIRRSSSPTIHVLVGRNGRERRAGIRLHWCRALPADEVTTLDGLPITTPARTLLDLAAGGLRGRYLEAAIDAAERKRLLDFADLHKLLERYPGRAGTPALRAVLARYRGGDTRSELEVLIAELCDAHGLPRPLENCVIEGKVRDFYWPHARLVVEADSYAWHRSPRRWTTIASAMWS